jgi:hypothetical protein
MICSIRLMQNVRRLLLLPPLIAEKSALPVVVGRPLEDVSFYCASIRSMLVLLESMDETTSRMHTISTLRPLLSLLQVQCSSCEDVDKETGLTSRGINLAGGLFAGSLFGVVLATALLNWRWSVSGNIVMGLVEPLFKGKLIEISSDACRNVFSRWSASMDSKKNECAIAVRVMCMLWFEVYREPDTDSTRLEDFWRECEWIRAMVVWFTREDHWWTANLLKLVKEIQRKFTNSFVEKFCDSNDSTMFAQDVLGWLSVENLQPRWELWPLREDFVKLCIAQLLAMQDFQRTSPLAKDLQNAAKSYNPGNMNLPSLFSRLLPTTLLANPGLECVLCRDGSKPMCYGVVECGHVLMCEECCKCLHDQAKSSTVICPKCRTEGITRQYFLG